MKKILVCSDLSNDSRAVFSAVKSLTEDMDPAKFSVALLNVLEVTGPFVFSEGTAFGAADFEPFLKDFEKSCGRELEQLAKEHFAGLSWTVSVERSRLPVYEEILNFAESQKCDVIVMAKHGKSGWQRLLLGSMTAKVAQLSKIPVLIVPETRR